MPPDLTLPCQCAYTRVKFASAWGPLEWSWFELTLEQWFGKLSNSCMPAVQDVCCLAGLCVVTISCAVAFLIHECQIRLAFMGMHTSCTCRKGYITHIPVAVRCLIGCLIHATSCLLIERMPQTSSKVGGAGCGC